MAKIAGAYCIYFWAFVGLLTIARPAFAQVNCYQNMFDPEVINSGPDMDRDGISDALDLDKNNDGSADSKMDSKDVSDLQLSIWKRFGIIFFNCGEARHDTRTMSAFVWVLETVFTDVFKNGGFPTLKYIASTNKRGASVYRPALKMLSTSGLIRLKRDGSPSDPILMFANIVHELGHAYHAMVKETPDSVNDLVFKEFFGSEGKISSTDWNEIGRKEINAILSSYKSGTLSQEAFLSVIPSLQADACISKGSLVCECRAPTLRENFIVSKYGATSPAEYYAESLVAAFFKEVSRGLGKYKQNLFEFEVGRRYMGHQFLNLHPALEVHFEQKLNFRNRIPSDIALSLLEY